jgi:uncharacterized protein YndB with AHSA1/START domain
MTRSAAYPPNSTVAKVTRTINRPIAEVFDYIVPVSIPHIFPRQGEAAGVVATSITSDWGTPGQQRIVTMDDDSTFHETLLTIDQNKSFTYKCEDFTSEALSGTIQGIEGGWTFVDNGNDTTSLEWNYALIPASEETLSIVVEQLVPVYRDRLETAVTILKSDLEIRKLG